MMKRKKPAQAQARDASANADHENRTGTSMAPNRIKEMLAGMEEFPPSSEGGTEDLAEQFAESIRESEPVGSIPMPDGGAENANGSMLAFMDKLGERLAFERSGTRLYEALIAKHEAGTGFRGGPSRADLEEICNEERAHFDMLVQAMTRLDGDPTAVTPSADVAGVMTQGILQVVTDARTSLLESLEAMLVAELADHECWGTLVLMARSLGHDKLADQMEDALRTEEEHLDKVRGWVAAGMREKTVIPRAS